MKNSNKKGDGNDSEETITVTLTNTQCILIIVTTILIAIVVTLFLTFLLYETALNPPPPQALPQKLDLSSLRFLRLTLLIYTKDRTLRKSILGFSSVLYSPLAQVLLAYASLLPLLGIFLIASTIFCGIFVHEQSTFFLQHFSAFLGVIINESVNNILKDSIKEPRPIGGPEQLLCRILNDNDTSADDMCIESYGFPSSHTQMMVRAVCYDNVLILEITLSHQHRSYVFIKLSLLSLKIIL